MADQADRDEVWRLLEACRDDDVLRRKIRNARREVIEAAGYSLPDEYYAQIDQIDWTKTDDEILIYYMDDDKLGPLRNT